MKLEDQLDTLENLGLGLNPGVTIDELLYSFDREAYEEEPYDLILFVLGTEVERPPWGRSVCSSAWNLDMECICETGDYVTIVSRFCEVANLKSALTDIEDYVDIESGEAWLKYVVDGQPRHFKVKVDNDWADPDTIAAVMSDLERDGFHFYGKDNGQATIWFYLNAETAAKLNQLTNGALQQGPYSFSKPQ
jgi:hypothetical protein